VKGKISIAFCGDGIEDGDRFFVGMKLEEAIAF
jgi:hypothetical protein